MAYPVAPLLQRYCSTFKQYARFDSATCNFVQDDAHRFAHNDNASPF